MDAPLLNLKSDMPRIDSLSSMRASASIRAARAACAEQLANGPYTRRSVGSTTSQGPHSLRRGASSGTATTQSRPSLHDFSERPPSVTTRRPQHNQLESKDIRQEDHSPFNRVDTPHLTSCQQEEVFRPADARRRFSASQTPNRDSGSLSSSSGSASETAQSDRESYPSRTSGLNSSPSHPIVGDFSWLDPMLSSTPPRCSPSLSPFASSPMASPPLATISLDALINPVSITPSKKHMLGLLPPPIVDSSSLERLRRSSPAKRRSRSKRNALSSGKKTLSSLLGKFERNGLDKINLLMENSKSYQLEHSHVSPRASPVPPHTEVEKNIINHDWVAESSNVRVAPESTEVELLMQPLKRRGGKNGRNQPPRPPNPWILYRSAQIQRLRADPRFVKTSQCEISRLISYMWRDETPESRLKYEQLAAEAKAAHAIAYPDYTYRPAKRPRRNVEPTQQEATTLESSDCTSSTPIDSDLLSCTSSSLPSVKTLNEWGSNGPKPDSQWASGQCSEASWLPAAPSTVESLDSSIEHLLASLDYPTRFNNALELDTMCDNTNPLWSSTMNHSPDVNASQGWGISASPFLDMHHAQMVPFSAPAAFSAFEFGSVPSSVEGNLFDGDFSLRSAPLSPSFIASSPLSYDPSRFELSSSTSSASSMASADDVEDTFSSPGTIASSVTSASAAPSPANSIVSPLWLDHRTPFTSASHTPIMLATSVFEKDPISDPPAGPMKDLTRFDAGHDILVDQN
ncbi:BZ3500_MvSof-1268-A1-R1_Chr1-1g00984 [Microbotryum saponariae]|uniref:BZ3500_MvSof-1268-A1-R1_Chr1-1g00984 protein n=1 Tax=Microbotryum saponariae TaxID=289078 RepID=A0A2X0KA95_9BASI|nr:BZ3500_MvSof-1268-A1-R1_Chr1-1g00984 [Microbotryum saponariae]SCZ93102.1 BZ3501_MvSof-1269-A2-R1_Chr1-1g00581 [Microbotryum saponariae]